MKLTAIFDAVLMRKDPPFNMEYIYATYLLEMIEANGTPVLNKPGSIRDCNEKAVRLAFSGMCSGAHCKQGSGQTSRISC